MNDNETTKSGKKRISKKRKSFTNTKKDSSREKVLVIKRAPANEDHLVSISKSVGTASVLMTALVVTLTPSNVWVLGPVIGAMCIFGVAMSYFATK